jgi:hypothetical protein
MDESKLARVRALLAKAESTEFPDEAEALTAKAAELMARYGIEEAHLAASGRTTDRVISLVLPLTQPYSMEKATLATVVAEATRCRAVTTKRGRVAIRTTVIGYASDLQRVELLYTSLLLQATTQVTRQRPAYWGESIAAYRRTWWLGFSSAVMHRLQAAERQAAAETPTTNGTSTELVLRSRTEVVESRYAALYPGVKPVERQLSGSGYDSGVAAGRRANLNQTGVGTGRQSALR